MRGNKAAITPVFGDPAGSNPPEPPSWLTDDARAEWDRVLPTLLNVRRTLTSADLATFANYCTAIGQVAEAGRILKEQGLTYSGPSGPKRHPAVAIRSDGMTQARQIAAELGLTPASRGRPGIRSGEGGGDGVNDLFSDYGLD